MYANKLLLKDEFIKELHEHEKYNTKRMSECDKKIKAYENEIIMLKKKKKKYTIMNSKNVRLRNNIIKNAIKKDYYKSRVYL